MPFMINLKWATIQMRLLRRVLPSARMVASTNCSALIGDQANSVFRAQLQHLQNPLIRIERHALWPGRELECE